MILLVIENDPVLRDGETLFPLVTQTPNKINTLAFWVMHVNEFH